VLGTSEPIYRATSKQSIPPSPGHMSITVSEASFGSQQNYQQSGMDHDGYLTRPAVSRRPSSNVMGHAYSGEGRRGSDYSTASRQLHPQTSNSTLRSHYDAKNSPLSISQQTSDSAVRDMAWRRGNAQLVPDYNSNGYVVSPVSPGIQDEARRREQRKSKPARLDLSKLFPKPRGGEASAHSNALLSPAKMVNSPAAMSFTSEYQFPRPMTREPTPNPSSQEKPKKLQRKQASAPPTPSSPARKFERDQYDNAKVHVRRPPKGVRHWFDALDEDSDEVPEASAPIHAPKAVRPQGLPNVPVRKASLDRLAPDVSTKQTSRSHYLSPAGRSDNFTHEDLVDITRLTSPSQYSLQSTKTRESTKTKESALSKTNLQDSSVLSFSSSEDEGEGSRAAPRKMPVRKSLDVSDDTGEIVIGQAQAFEVRSQRRPSAAQLSMRSSTSAATIEVMYTPEPPFTPMHYNNNHRTSSYSGSRRSSHLRQPSVIHEDDDYRPRTAVNTPASPPARSVRSARTSTSEPKPSSDGTHKFMAVTAEEEALLELMRKKRAAMGMSPVPQATQAPEEQQKRHKAPIEASHKPYRTSGFLAEASPVRVPEQMATKRSSAIASSPLQLPPRGRPLKAHYDASHGQSQLRDSSTSDAWSEHQSSPASRPVSRVTIPHQLPTPSPFSPLDPFPHSSPVLTASMASPTTTEHPSPLPSPVTPGLRAYEEELNVKVASSDTSNENDDIPGLETGMMDAIPERVKSHNAPRDDSTHRRRRTASSDADVSFPVPPTHGLTDLTPVSEVSSRAPSIIEPPRLPTKSSKRVSGLTLLTNNIGRNRQSSVNSSHSQASSRSIASSLLNGPDKRASSRQVTRQSSSGSMSVHSSAKSKRNSVNDDVLAAWSSLGGTY
jgi:CDGSH-type Zn-finger protein